MRKFSKIMSVTVLGLIAVSSTASAASAAERQ